VEGLDLTRYVKGPDSDKPQIYDLYGVSVRCCSLAADISLQR
jgi:hypothetical protein